MWRDGAPGRTRTPNLLIRSQALYPIELRAHSAGRVRRRGKLLNAGLRRKNQLLRFCIELGRCWEIQLVDRIMLL